MEFILDIFSWFKASWADIAEIYLYIIGVASIVVKLTPSKEDDAWLAKIVAFVSKWLALNPEKKKK